MTERYPAMSVRPQATSTALLLEIRAYIIVLLAAYGISRDWEGTSTTQLVKLLDGAITHEEGEVSND